MCASVCTEDESNGDRHDVHVCTSYGTCGYMHMYLCAVKGGSTEKPVTWELHMYEENIVSFTCTQCVHVHKSVRVTVRSCSHILL